MSRSHSLQGCVSALAALLVLPAVAEAQACGTEVVLKRLDAGAVGPELTTPNGAAVVGGPFSLRVTGAFPNSSGALVYSPVEAPFFDPTYGATFHFGAPFKAVFFTTDSEGNGPPEFALAALDPFLCGGFVIFQAGVFDPAAQNGVAVSNALRLVVGSSTGRIFRPEPPLAGGGHDSVLADMDGDGLRDLVAVHSTRNQFPILNPGVHTVSTRLGLPTGGFAETGTDFVVDDEAASVDAADFDGDGHVDVITTVDSGNRFLPDNRFQLILGDGNGGLSPAGFFPAGIDPVRAAIDDFDLDGRLDVVVAAIGDTRTSVRYGEVGGGFSVPTWFEIGGAADVATGDLDENGFPDFVAAIKATDRVAVMAGDENGDFTLNGPFVMGAGPHRVALGDFDGDTDLDLVTANHASEDITLRPGNGNGFFSGVTTVLPTGRWAPRDILAADLDSDGALDLAVVNTWYEDVTLMLGNGDGTFEHEHVGGLHSPDAVHSTDYDLDGNLDLLVTGDPSEHDMPYGESHAVFPGDGEGRFEGVRHVHHGEKALDSFGFETLVEDLDNDGLEDVIVNTRDGFSVSIGLGGERFAPTVTYAIPSPSRGFSLDDFDSDGFMDVVLIHPGPGSKSDIAVLLNAGDGTLGSPSTLTTAFVGDVYSKDVDGDTFPDLVIAYGTSQAISFLSVAISKGNGSFEFPGFYGAGGFVTDLVPEDLNGDTFPDLAYSVTDETFNVRLNKGDGTFTSAVVHPAVDANHLLLSGDLNNDLALDFLAGTEVFLNDGAGAFTSAGSVAIALAWPVLHDVDGDGVLDIVGVEMTGFWGAIPPQSIGAVGVHLGNGDGTFGAQLTSPGHTFFGIGDFFRTSGLFLDDLDGDGLTDAVLLDVPAGEITMFRGDGGGTFSGPETHFVARGIEALRSADLDGDGIRDLVAGSISGRFAVLINQLGE